MAPISFRDAMAENHIQLTQQSNELRQRFFDWYDVNSNEYDEEDVRQLRENDFYCHRFVSHSIGLHDTADRAFEMVKSVFKWRKEVGANQMKASDFPENFKAEEFYPYRKDKEGNVTFILRACKHVKDPKTKELYQKYMIYNLEKIERKYNRRKHVTIIVDCKDAGLSNVEMDFVFYIRTLSMKRYPLLLSYVVVVNMSWIFTAAWKIVKSWLPQRAVERIFFVNDKTIYDHIDEEDLPEDLGGLDKTVYPVEGDPFSHLPESLLTDMEAMTVSVQ